MNSPLRPCCSQYPCLEINNQPSAPPVCLHLTGASLLTTVQINLDSDPMEHSDTFSSSAWRMCLNCAECVCSTGPGGAERWGDGRTCAKFIPVYLPVDSNHFCRKMMSPAQFIPRERAVQSLLSCVLSASSLSLLPVLAMLADLWTRLDLPQSAAVVLPWFNPSWQLSSTQPLAHCPCQRDGGG